MASRGNSLASEPNESSFVYGFEISLCLGEYHTPQKAIRVAMTQLMDCRESDLHSTPLLAMNLPNIETPKLNLSRRPGQPPLLVDMERFFEFSFWMAEELLDLVALHSEDTNKNSKVNPMQSETRPSSDRRFEWS